MSTIPHYPHSTARKVNSLMTKPASSLLTFGVSNKPPIEQESSPVSVCYLPPHVPTLIQFQTSSLYCLRSLPFTSSPSYARHRPVISSPPHLSSPKPSKTPSQTSSHASPSPTPGVISQMTTVSGVPFSYGVGAQSLTQPFLTICTTRNDR